MVHMFRVYLTEKQLPRLFCYFAIKYATKMMNVIPGKYKGKLTSPFMLVHGVRVVPMEITFMDNGGNIFVLDEFREQMNSYT
jgi:hypothetical protein